MLVNYTNYNIENAPGPVSNPGRPRGKIIQHIPIRYISVFKPTLY